MSELKINDLLKSAINLDRRISGEIVGKKKKPVKVDVAPENSVDIVEEDYGYADELSDLNSNGMIDLIEQSDKEKLEEIKGFESAGKNRQGVMKAIEKREKELAKAE